MEVTIVSGGSSSMSGGGSLGDMLDGIFSSLDGDA